MERRAPMLSLENAHVACPATWNSPKQSHLRDQRGFMLIELLVAMLIALAVIGAAEYALTSTTRIQQRDQSYAQELQSAEVALARMLSDLRKASSILAVQPGLIEFQMQSGGTTYNVEYNCSAPDTLGSPYARCARTQAVAPATPPAATANANPPGTDIQHVWNNPTNTSDLSSGSNYATFCNTAGTGPSGAVFYVQNPNYPNTTGLSCENYELELASAQPDYVQVRIQVPASGDQARGGLTHSIVLQNGAYIQNLDPSQ